VVQGSVVQLISVLLMFYFLFFFLRDRRKVVKSLRWLSPLPEPTTDQIRRRVVETIQAIFYGTVVVAVVQGTLGGLMFWWLGLAAPLLWGIMMGLLAIVPVLGASIIWLPAAIFLALEGSWGKAIVLTLWGSIVVGGIDNLLYPMLVGNRLKMHTAVAFIAVVGGLLVYGPSGVILGPVAVAVTISLLEYWHSRNVESAGTE
jgi:predicted PurR-regulated permease PerM